MTKFIKGQTIDYIWPIIIEKIMNDGQEVMDERGSKTKELTNLVIEITDPLNSKIPKGYPFSGRMLENYKDQLLNPDKKGFTYTYGNRLRKYFGVDQIKDAITRLKNCKESRRAISITWDAMDDGINEDVPCMILVDFKIRNNKLNTGIIFRSNDMFGAWVSNAFAILELAKYVSDELNVEVGSIVTHSISAHIYEHNWHEALKV
jgi:thymidylate synthase